MKWLLILLSVLAELLGSLPNRLHHKHHSLWSVVVVHSSLQAQLRHSGIRMIYNGGMAWECQNGGLAWHCISVSKSKVPASAVKAPRCARKTSVTGELCDDTTTFSAEKCYEKLLAMKGNEFYRVHAANEFSASKRMRRYLCI